MNEGIPTNYHGTRYRSRLEARWAAFFDLLKWDTHYEPFDLDGYIPDFVVHGRTWVGEKIPILIEIKPVSGETDPLFTATAQKIARSGWRHEALIVSYFLPYSECCNELSVGWLCDEADYIKWEPDPTAPLTFSSWAYAPFQEVGAGSQALVGFCHEYQSYHDRISGVNPHSTGIHNEASVIDLWAQAGKAVQWRAEHV
jgi:hypothetical protein